MTVAELHAALAQLIAIDKGEIPVRIAVEGEIVEASTVHLGVTVFPIRVETVTIT
jgi:hypothetical protein